MMGNDGNGNRVMMGNDGNGNGVMMGMGIG